MESSVNQGKSLVATDKSIIFCTSLAKVFDVSGALLLQQIQYWVEVKPNIKDGHAWNYNTAAALAEQLGVFTEQTVRKKLRSMEEMGVLKSGVFNRKRYDRTKWYRIDYEVLCQVMSEKLGGVWQSLPQPSGSGHRIQQVINNGPIPKSIKKNNFLESGASLSALPGLTPLAKPQAEISLEKPSGKINPEGSYEELAPVIKSKTKPGKQNATATTSEILEKHPEDSKITAMNTTAGLYHLWDTKMASLNGGLSPGLTPKEKGQLKQFLTKTGSKANKALDFALNNWGKFCWKVKTKKGQWSAPESPLPGYILANYDVLLQLIAQTVELPKQEPVAIVKPEPAPKPIVAEEVVDGPSIAEMKAELEAFLNVKKKGS